MTIHTHFPHPLECPWDPAQHSPLGCCANPSSVREVGDDRNGMGGDKNRCRTISSKRTVVKVVANCGSWQLVLHFLVKTRENCEEDWVWLKLLGPSICSKSDEGSDLIIALTGQVAPLHTFFQVWVISQVAKSIKLIATCVFGSEWRSLRRLFRSVG